MTAVIFPVGKGKPQIGTELDEREIYAIGYVTIGWAYLEHCLLAMTLQIAEAAKIEAPADARSLSFKKRLEAARTLIKQSVSAEKKRTQLLDILRRIGNLERSRNRITHGLWEWDIKAPERLRSSSYRPPYDFDEPFDFDKLMKIGEQIGEVNFEMTYPSGKRQWLRERLKTPFGISRKGVLLLTGKAKLPDITE